MNRISRRLTLAFAAVALAAGLSAPAALATVPDPPTLTGAPVDTVSTTSISVSISGVSGATFTCSLDSATPSTCTSPFVATGLADGEHTLSVTQTDEDSNESDPQVVTWTVDTVAPDAPEISPVTTPARDHWFGLEFTTPLDGILLECAMGASPSAGDWATCSSPYSPNDGWPEGEQTFNVRATDVAGNVSNVASVTFTMDYTDPAAPTVTPVTSPTNDTSAPIEFEVSEDTVSTKCASVSGPTESDWVDCTSPFVPEGGWSEGYRTAKVRAFDQAGNFSTTTIHFTVDTTPPATPSITAPGMFATTNTNQVEFTEVSGLTYKCQANHWPATDGDIVDCTSPFDISGLEDGESEVKVWAYDAAGNESTPASIPFVRDTTAPDTPSITAPSPFATYSANQVEFTEESGLTYKCQANYWPNSDGDIVDCTNPFDISGLTDGAVFVKIWAYDAAGNESSPAAVPFVRQTTVPDTTPPDAPGLSGTPSSPTNSTSAEISFTGESGGSFTCSVDGGDYEACTSPKSFTALSEGEHTLDVKQTDDAGNTGDASNATWTVDTTPPPVPSLSGLPTGVTLASGATATFSTTEPGATFECRLLMFGTIGTCSSPWIITGLNAGVKTVYVRSKDAAGNVSAWATKTWSVRNPCGTPFMRGPIYKDLGKGNVQIRPFASPADVRAACQLLTVQVWNGTTKPLNSDHLTNTPSFSMKILKYSSLIKLSAGKTFVPKWIRVENKVGTWSEWYALGKTR